ncbi:S-adenosylmethionine-dependent methyltransferase NDAI_0I01900 [Naumovozyma dairenensis CBS 421]|uniref:Protein N-terminal and lysine N-methyltransferase EFM7 n=1 Tax=Naumovozyma dairenensis (strain ATCC 10597 / BCRC 20456 / CBS 421 / NBRC 0211 / NRRL Y-12639) TaxID=1071378 RepID=G0WG48_NAUDC|nr:hypothetical protein NDAI_0I01900 [Naumovozyma dairenensis CBS 421]CCD26759.1 hypothetical protein NDAI_0I01900 [Naumovozyma dairenensis CBS 421]
MVCQQDLVRLRKHTIHRRNVRHRITQRGALFEEPNDFRPEPPKSHFATYERTNINKDVSKSDKITIKLRLVGNSPLWGHLLWNAGIYTAKHLDLYPNLVKNKNVLELGAAGALPSIVSALIGAKMVVSTDYPDPELISNIQFNADEQIPRDFQNIAVEGYIWGNKYDDIVKHITDKPSANGETLKFDLIILSDLVFNHSEHHKLLSTTKDLLAKDGKALVVFSPHRPWLLDDDLQFFETAKEHGLTPEFIEMVNWKPMFEEDAGPAEVRARVYAYYLKHS